MVYRLTERSARIRQESQTRILNSARKLFARQGYDATTMQQVVHDAGTSIGNAYFYFENKEALVKALVEKGLRDAWARTDPIIASVEIGPSQIAVAVYSDIMSLLGPEKDLAAIAVMGMPTVVRYITEMIWDRLCVLFGENFPERDPAEVLLISAVVFGANRLVVELCLTGVLDVRAEDAAKYCVGWHLRALEVSEAKLARAIRLAARTYKTAVLKARRASERV